MDDVFFLANERGWAQNTIFKECLAKNGWEWLLKARGSHPTHMLESGRMRSYPISFLVGVGCCTSSSLRRKEIVFPLVCSPKSCGCQHMVQRDFLQTNLNWIYCNYDCMGTWGVYPSLKRGTPIFASKNTLLFLNEAVETLSSIGCNPNQLVPTMNANVANTFIFFKSTNFKHSYT